MRRRLLVLTVALLLAAMMVAAGPAFAEHVAEHVEEHPFCDSGRDYAQDHITDMAQNDSPGLTGPPTPRDPDPDDEHAPGNHRGHAVCDPSGHAGSE
jgi:hypothetical protein